MPPGTKYRLLLETLRTGKAVHADKSFSEYLESDRTKHVKRLTRVAKMYQGDLKLVFRWFRLELKRALARRDSQDSDDEEDLEDETF